MTKLQLNLLGEPRLSVGETSDVRLPTKKSQALLIYLASPPGVARSRDQLAGLLWSRNAEEQARTSLRQNLARLRKSLGDAKDAISADAHLIALVPALIETDTAKLESLAALSDVASLEAAANLVSGEFASGLSINEPPFEEWIAGERRRFAELSGAAMRKLLTHYEDNEDFENVAVIAEKILKIDPLQESVHQALMRSLAHQDRFESALQQYKLCRDLLRKELQIEPSHEIRVLRDEISRRRETGGHAPKAPTVETRGLVRVLGGHGSGNRPAATDLPPQLQGLDLTTPQRPSIVILPFANLTGDAGQDFLAEGIRIDIQAALIKITGIFLIAAGSANAMRGRASQPAGDALGVRYVLQGGIRRAGSKLRISAELIDIHVGNAIWTDTYDRQFDDGFEVQDEIIAEIITALDVKLLRGEQAAVWHKTLKNRDALECFYKGVTEFFKLRKESMARARRLFERVDKLQPRVSTGATWVAMCHWFDAFKGWRDDPAGCLAKAGEWSGKAVQMEDADGQAHMVLSHVHLMNRRFDDALIIGREAVKLRPNCTNANGFFANVLHYCGEQQDAIEHVTWAIRYSPVYPPFFADVLSLALLFDGSLDAAITVTGESLRLNPGGQTARLVAISAHWQQGAFNEARQIAEQVAAADSSFSVQRFVRLQPYRNQADIAEFAAAMKSAGLPD